MGKCQRIAQLLQYARHFRERLVDVGDGMEINTRMFEVLAALAHCEDQLDAVWEEFNRLHSEIVTRYDGDDMSELYVVIWDGADYGRTMQAIMKRKVAT